MKTQQIVDLIYGSYRYIYDDLLNHNNVFMFVYNKKFFKLVFF